jgi:uncharacterized protein (DUF433 family)
MKLFGELALQKGYLTPEQLSAALEVQDREAREQQAYRFIGEILVDLGYMSEKQVLDCLNALHMRRPTA